MRGRYHHMIQDSPLKFMNTKTLEEMVMRHHLVPESDMALFKQLNAHHDEAQAKAVAQMRKVVAVRLNEGSTPLPRWKGVYGKPVPKGKSTEFKPVEGVA